MGNKWSPGCGCCDCRCRLTPRWETGCNSIYSNSSFPEEDFFGIFRRQWIEVNVTELSIPTATYPSSVVLPCNGVEQVNNIPVTLSASSVQGFTSGSSVIYQRQTLSSHHLFSFDCRAGQVDVINNTWRLQLTRIAYNNSAATFEETNPVAHDPLLTIADQYDPAAYTWFTRVGVIGRVQPTSFPFDIAKDDCDDKSILNFEWLNSAGPLTSLFTVSGPVITLKWS